MMASDTWQHLKTKTTTWPVCTLGPCLLEKGHTYERAKSPAEALPESIVMTRDGTNRRRAVVTVRTEDLSKLGHMLRGVRLNHLWHLLLHYFVP